MVQSHIAQMVPKLHVSHSMKRVALRIERSIEAREGK